MLFRTLTMFGLALTLTAGCPTSDDDTSNDEDDAGNDDEDTTPTDPPDDPFFRPENLLVLGGFGYDTVNGTVLSVTDPVAEEAVPNQYGVYIYANNWDFSFASTEDFCEILMPLENATFRNTLDTPDPEPRFFGINWNRALDEADLTRCNMDNYELDPNDFPEGYSFFDTFWNVNADQDSTLTDAYIAITDPTDPEWADNFNQDVLDEFSFGCVVGIPAGRYSLGGNPVSNIPICVTDAFSVIDDEGTPTFEVNDTNEAIALNRDTVTGGVTGFFDVLIPDGIVPFFPEQ